jgi:hypothetical protein
MPQSPAGDREKLAVRRDIHDRLRDSERDVGQEIVSGGEHRDQQQVEVGEHRGPLRVDADNVSTADFDPVATSSYSTRHHVESTI